jgi:hypothetical protein
LAKVLGLGLEGDEIEIQKSMLLEAGLLNIFGKALRAGVPVAGWADGEEKESEAE